MKKLLVVFLVLVGMRGMGQGTFQKTYGGQCNLGGPSHVNITSDGGYIAVGNIINIGAGGYDIYLVKTDLNGDTLWTKTLGGPSNDYGYSVQETNDGGYILLGSTLSFDTTGNSYVYLIKTNSIGDTLWTKIYGGSADNWGYSVQQTNDNGYIIVGTTSSFGIGNYDVYLIKTDSNGIIKWTKTYGGTHYDEGMEVQQTTDGGYIIAGSSDSFNTQIYYNAYIIKTDSVGDTLWTKTYGGINNDDSKAYSVRQTNDGGFIIAGWTASFGGGGYLIKTNSNGDTLWTKIYNGAAAYSIQITTDGGYIIAGYSANYDTTGIPEICLIKTNSNGDISWSKVYGEISGTNISVQQTFDGGYIVSGITSNFGFYQCGIYLIKTDANGNSGCYQGNASTIAGTTSTLIQTPHTQISSGGNVKSPNTKVSFGGIVTTFCFNDGIPIINNNFTISLFPNPFSTTATLSIRNYESGIRNGEVQIIDLMGRVVKTIPITDTRITINREQLSDGMYFYKIIGTNSETIATGKMVIQ